MADLVAVDATVLLRLLQGEPVDKAAAADRLLRQAEQGEVANFPAPCRVCAVRMRGDIVLWTRSGSGESGGRSADGIATPGPRNPRTGTCARRFAPI